MNSCWSGRSWPQKKAGTDAAKFLKLFEKYVKAPVRADPSLLTKAGWGR